MDAPDERDSIAAEIMVNVLEGAMRAKPHQDLKYRLTFEDTVLIPVGSRSAMVDAMARLPKPIQCSGVVDHETALVTCSAISRGDARRTYLYHQSNLREGKGIVARSAQVVRERKGSTQILIIGPVSRVWASVEVLEKWVHDYLMRGPYSIDGRDPNEDEMSDGAAWVLTTGNPMLTSDQAEFLLNHPEIMDSLMHDHDQ